MTKMHNQIFIFCFCLLTSVYSFSQQNDKLNMPTAPEEELVSKRFVEKVLPKQINENESGNAVISRMADDVLAYWWESTPLRNSAIVKAAENLEKKAQLNAVVTDSHHTSHVFDFKVLLLQALARLEYKGWINAGVTYNLRSLQTEAEISQPLSQDKDLVLTQQVNTDESLSKISLKFKW